ncbi:MAG: hypothetical protein SFW36_21020 [Leptolyngbyaceae cyanobacterium bins.59]|nr:hypothetical protein [Leptolyngbyaceae cyanobacterium bins.59]
MKVIYQTLVFAALVLSVILCLELLTDGYASFNLALQGKAVSLAPPFPVRLRFGLAYLGIHLIYLLWVGRWLKRSKVTSPSEIPLKFFYSAFPRAGFAAVVRKSLIFLILAFLTYPISTDIYLYLHYGLMGLEGVNPYLVRAGDFASILTPLLRWFQSSTYGPVSQIFFMGAAALVPFSPLAAVYGFKFLCLLSHLWNGLLVWHILKESNDRESLTLAYVVNPVLLFEQIGAAHVDVFVCTALLVLIYSVKQRQYLTAMVAGWLGVLAKTIPILWLPLGIVFLLRRGQWGRLGLAFVIIGGSIASLTHTLLPTIAAWQSLLNPGVAGKSINSLQAILHLFLLQSPQVAIPTRLAIVAQFQLVTLVVCGGYYLFALLKLMMASKASEDRFILEMGWVVLLLLLFATPWLMPWYISVLIPIAIVQPHARRFGSLVLLASFTASCSYLLIGTGYLQGAVVVGIPILVLLFQLLQPSNQQEYSAR